jgi:hypothetical protein
MAKRTSLGANVTAPDKAKKAAEVARKMTAPNVEQTNADPPEYETVSYNLPLDLIDLCRDLARERHVRDQAAKREQRARIKAAKKAGLPPPLEAPEQARQSASAIIREALEAHRAAIEVELKSLRG